MRNIDQDAADGSHPFDETNGVQSSAVMLRARRRQQAVAGALGLAVLLGASVVAFQLRDGDRTTTTGGPAPFQAMATTSGSPEPSADVSVAGASTAVKPHVASTPAPATARDRVKAAREAAAKNGFPVKRPRPISNGAATVVADRVKVSTSGSLKQSSGTMKVVSARQDLTGYREMGWVTDETEPAGDDVRCTRTIRLTNDEKARKLPTLLLCWRMSATRSVYTVAVNVKRQPLVQDSVAAIDRAWSRLG